MTAWRVRLSPGPRPRLRRASLGCVQKRGQAPVGEPWPPNAVRAQDVSSGRASQGPCYAHLLSRKPVDMEGDKDQGGQGLCCYKQQRSPTGGSTSRFRGIPFTPGPCPSSFIHSVSRRLQSTRVCVLLLQASGVKQSGSLHEHRSHFHGEAGRGLCLEPQHMPGLGAESARV